MLSIRKSKAGVDMLSDRGCRLQRILHFSCKRNCVIERVWMPMLVCLLLTLFVGGAYGQDLPGTWDLLVPDAGVAAMHGAVSHFGPVILLDRTDIGATTLPLPNGACRDDANELVLKVDCSAHSIMFDPITDGVRPLEILTDTWCSSGQFFPDGTLVQTGGDFDGFQKVRTLAPCPSNGTCDWVESTTETLQVGRWYATNQLLPDGTQIIVGGRSTNTIEFIPANGRPLVPFPFLNATQPNNLYPFVHLLPDGTLFVFANQDSIIYDYLTDTVIMQFPPIPGEPRNYPAAGSSVMLPLMASNDYSVVEILVCGGAQANAFANPQLQLVCSITCGRMAITDPVPAWTMEEMPIPRCMGDMIILPTREILIINGAQQGSQGWGDAENPALNPVAYDPDAAVGLRFAPWAPTTIPRMYHSVANLLADGRVLLSGSNPHQFYTTTGAFPTELRIEAFSPPYLSTIYDITRPTITAAPPTISYNTPFTLTLTLAQPPVAALELNLLSAPFVTHSFAQGQRLLSLAVGPLVPIGPNTYSVTCTPPPIPQLAPAAYYMLFPVLQGTPGTSVWVQLIASGP